MKENNSVDTTIVSILDDAYMLSKGRCVKHLNVPGLLFALFLICVGIILVMIPLKGVVTDKNFTSGISMFGLISIGYAIYLLFAKNRKMVYSSTGSPMLHRMIYFDAEQADELCSFVNGDSCHIPDSCTQGGALMQAYVTKDGIIAYVQVKRYHDLVYEPITEPTRLNDNQTLVLTEFLRTCK